MPGSNETCLRGWFGWQRRIFPKSNSCFRSRSLDIGTCALRCQTSALDVLDKIERKIERKHLFWKPSKRRFSCFVKPMRTGYRGALIQPQFCKFALFGCSAAMNVSKPSAFCSATKSLLAIPTRLDSSLPCLPSAVIIVPKYIIHCCVCMHVLSGKRISGLQRAPRSWNLPW